MITLNSPFFTLHTYAFLIGLGILFVFLFLNYFFKRWKINNLENIQKMRFKKHFFEISISFFLGILSLSFLGLYYINDNHYVFYIYFVFFFIISINYNILSGFFYIFPIGIGWPIVSTILHFNSLLIGLFYVVFVIYWLGLGLCNILDWNKWWQYTLIIFIGIFINIFLCYLMIGKSQLIWFSVLMLLNYLAFLFYYAFDIFLNNTLSDLEKLNASIIYRNNQFVNSVYAHELIYEKINQLNCSTGLVLLFNFSNIDNISARVGNFAASNIKNKLIENMANIFHRYQPIFYLTEKNEYACFFPISNFEVNKLQLLYDGNYKNIRPENDPLKEFAVLFNALPNKLNFNNTKISIKVNASMSIYGIQSCDLKQLENTCRRNFANLISSRNHNIIYVNNPAQNYFDVINDEVLKRLSVFLPKKDLYFNITQITNLQLDYSVYQCELNCISKLFFNESEIKKNAIKENIYVPVSRFLAFESLKIFRKQINDKTAKIIINYPIIFLSSKDFILEFFLRKIENLNLDLDQIILKLDLNDKYIYNTNLISNLKRIKDNSILLFYMNANDLDLDLINEVKPDFISYSFLCSQSKLRDLFQRYLVNKNIYYIDEEKSN